MSTAAAAAAATATAPSSAAAQMRRLRKGSFLSAVSVSHPFEGWETETERHRPVHVSLEAGHPREGIAGRARASACLPLNPRCGVQAVPLGPRPPVTGAPPCPARRCKISIIQLQLSITTLTAAGASHARTNTRIHTCSAPPAPRRASPPRTPPRVLVSGRGRGVWICFARPRKRGPIKGRPASMTTGTRRRNPEARNEMHAAFSPPPAHVSYSKHTTWHTRRARGGGGGGPGVGLCLREGLSVRASFFCLLSGYLRFGNFSFFGPINGHGQQSQPGV